MAEFLRQVAKDELSFTPEDVRRMSTLELPTGRLLDLTDPTVCDEEGSHLRSARKRGHEHNPRPGSAHQRKVCAPSAAKKGAITFVIFGEHLKQVVLTAERTVRILDYLDLPADIQEQES